MNLLIKNKVRLSAIMFIFLFISVFIGCNKPEKWDNALYTPTMIQKVEDTYFIVDCWHHRVIYNDNLSDSISEWNTLTDKVKGAHSIASDGNVYLVDDTDNSAVRVFQKHGNSFRQSQIIENIAGRPHYVMYDNTTESFYVISSTEQKIYTLINKSGLVSLSNVVTIPELGAYVRSFNIIDGFMYTVAGDNILKIDYKNNFVIVESYAVPENLSGMNYISYINNYFYISSYTNSNGQIAPEFIRIKNLDDLINNDYEDLYDTFGFKGTPYYISHFDNKYFITEIDASSGVKSFEVNEDKIINIDTLYYFEGYSNASYQRKQSQYE